MNIRKGIARITLGICCSAAIVVGASFSIAEAPGDKRGDEREEISEPRQIAVDKQATASEARARLSGALQTSESDRPLSLQDFEWGAITKRGPASGEDPSIGRNSKTVSFDFRDGLERPERHQPGR